MPDRRTITCPACSGPGCIGCANQGWLWLEIGACLLCGETETDTDCGDPDCPMQQGDR